MSELGKPARAKPALTHSQAVEFVLNDPATRAEVAKDPQVRRLRLAYAQNGAGVLSDLAAAGFPGLEEVGDLYRRRLDYKAAVPVLLQWLPKVGYLPLAEDIVRTLSFPLAKKRALPLFLKLFRQPPAVENPMRPPTSEPPAEHLRLVIGIGLGVFADPSVADDLIELALDRGFGAARVAIVEALPKTKDERVPEVLLSLLDDPPVTAMAVGALGKLRYAGARAPIAAMLDHPDKNVRDQAKRSLKRIEE